MLIKKNIKGFTLVELMVVILIISILLAISVLTFMGSRNRAYDNVAKQSLVNAAKTALGYYATESEFPDANAMGYEETSYKYIDFPANPPISEPPTIVIDKSNAELSIKSNTNTIFTMSINKGVIGQIDEE